MTLPVPSFGALGPQVNMSLLDNQFAAVANMGIIYCTASGSNALILTPIIGTLTPTSYLDGAPEFRWKQPQTSTGPVTISASGLSVLNAYKNNGATAVGTGDLIAGNLYSAVPLASLNAGAGGFVVDVVPTGLAQAGVVQAASKNLQVTVPSNTQVTITADQVSLFDGSNFTTAVSVNVTAATGTSGANGLDTGTIAQGVFYSVWVIQQTTTGTLAALLSTNATTPSLPVGYSKKARVGWVTTDAASTNLMKIIQNGRRAQYVVTGVSPNTALPTIASGSSGTITGATFTGTSTGVSAVVPSTASRIQFVLSTHGAILNVALAPNASYAGYGSATNPVPFMSSGGGASQPVVGEFGLETANVFYAASAASGMAQCLGWEDNI